MSLVSRIGSGMRAFGRGVARVQAWILLTIVYALLIGPVSVGARLFGHRFVPGREGSTFQDSRTIDDVETFGRRQF